VFIEPKVNYYYYYYYYSIKSYTEYTEKKKRKSNEATVKIKKKTAQITSTGVSLESALGPDFQKIIR